MALYPLARSASGSPSTTESCEIRAGSLPVVWSLLTDSDRPVLGTLLGIVVLTVLGCLFSGPATRWLADEYVDTDD